jgi:hypothetical protein
MYHIYLQSFTIDYSHHKYRWPSNLQFLILIDSVFGSKRERAHSIIERGDNRQENNWVKYSGIRFAIHCVKSAKAAQYQFLSKYLQLDCKDPSQDNSSPYANACLTAYGNMSWENPL